MKGGKTNDTQVLGALEYLSPVGMSYQEWIQVGMALKQEGYPVDVWREWSRKDTARFKEHEFESKWNSFHNDKSAPVTGGTIVDMAKKAGWQGQKKFTLFEKDGAINFGDTITGDGDKWTYTSAQSEESPCDELVKYLKALFKDDECVGYVTNDVWQDEGGDWKPKKGVCTRTAGELIKALQDHKGDIGAVVGDWKEETGAWVRFNPLDGKGVKDENVTQFRHALVECDDNELSIEDQYRAYAAANIPIACLVYSGGKSLHAIVKIDAKDKEQYRERVEHLYTYLQERGVPVDTQNKNASRLSRMPGVTRNGKRQKLVGTNVGAESWDAWEQWLDEDASDLPEVENLADFIDNLPPQPPELIEDVLRCGHKMLISGASKAGKSFLLLELCIAIAEGTPWIGFNCKQGRVLYVNLEIDRASCYARLADIVKAREKRAREDGLDWRAKSLHNVDVWTLRGHATPLDKLAPKLIAKARGKEYAAIIIDPIYKIITGDENNASEMGYFCNQFDTICNQVGCAVVYCHHHSKGAQGAKNAIDRASGSGVFARDPDAVLDMSELVLTDEAKNARDGSSTGWRIETSLREFAPIRARDIWFDHPLHYVDTGGALHECQVAGSAIIRAAKSKEESREKSNENLPKSGKRSKRVGEADFDEAFDACQKDGKVDIEDLADALDICEKSVYRKLREEDGICDRYSVKERIVTRNEER